MVAGVGSKGSVLGWSREAAVRSPWPGAQPGEALVPGAQRQLGIPAQRHTCTLVE